MANNTGDNTATVTLRLAELRAINEQLLLAGLREQAAAAEARQQAAALAHQAVHDALTDLPNATLFHDRLRQALLVAHRDHTTLALLLLDINGFKTINDRFGRATGDLVLQQVADRLREALRDPDTAARLGGDAFALLLQAVAGRPDAELAAHRVLQAVQAPYPIHDTTLHLTAGMGIAMSLQHVVDVDQLLHQADTAMNTAKRTGRGVVVAGFSGDGSSVLPPETPGAEVASGVTLVAQPPLPPDIVRASALAELRAVNERLLIAALREQALAEQYQRSMQALQTRTERWQLALEAGNLDFWELDLTTMNFQSWGNGHANVGLMPESDLTYTHLLEMIHPDDRPGMRAAIEQAIASGTDYAADYRVTRADGTIRWIAARGRPTYAADGTPLRLLGTTLDITEQRQHEDVLARRYEEEQHIRTQVERLAAERAAVLDQIDEGTVIADSGGRITFSNATGRRLLGLASAGVPASDDALALPADPLLLEQLAQVVRTGERIQTFRRRIRREDGREVVVNSSVTPLLGPEGQQVGAILALRDVTAEAALGRQKDDFLAAVAHDLRSPLTAIHGFAQLLRRRVVRIAPAGSAPLLADLGQIDGAVATMRRMLDALIDLSRLQLGQELQLQRIPTDLVALTRRVMNDYQHRTTEHTLTLETEQETLTGWWDVDRLERVIANLLSNAIKYSPAGGKVTVQVRRAHDRNSSWALLAVQDQGIGIPAADLPQLFERFRRGSNVTGRIAGSGIGLASVQQIVGEHGGSVTVASTEGQGSTFTVRLLLAPPTAAAPAND